MSGKKVILGITGVRAAERTHVLAGSILSAGYGLKIVPTPFALRIWDPINASDGTDVVVDVSGDPNSYCREASEEEHFKLRDWSDIILVAPLGPDTLAKLVNGICDNLLTSIFRSLYPGGSKKVIFAPWMEKGTWNNSLTGEQLNKLRQLYGSNHVEPVFDKFGVPDMASPERILKAIEQS